MNSETNRKPGPLIAVFCWRHALERDKEIVQTTWSGQATGESGIENASTAAQLLLSVSKGKRLEIFFGALICSIAGTRRGQWCRSSC